MTQPLVEELTADTIHTSRLIPVYSAINPIKPTILRKLLKQICDHLESLPRLPVDGEAMDLKSALQQLHFPDDEQQVIKARERLALEELIALIRRSHQVKTQWKADKLGIKLVETQVDENQISQLLPQTFPFQLTKAQVRASIEILNDLTEQTPMNRLLIGDVGAGKTIVAALAMMESIKAGYHACLVAPTQVLAEQHAQTLSKFFPRQRIELLTANNKQTDQLDEPCLIVGTHAILNWMEKTSRHKVKIGLLVYDEQHRFGVNQRSIVKNLTPHPHILTMTATPIPRSLMLTIFSHLAISVLDELPANRLPTKTWLVPTTKKTKMLEWINSQITQHSNQSSKKPTANFLTLYICPFIDPSDSEALENVASVKQKFEELSKFFKAKTNHKLNINILHGRQKKREQAEIIQQLYQGQINMLVTTPIVEVGIDLHQASAIIIDSAERFGMASLHQLRGRVGRAGQQGYCMLLTNSKNQETLDRLELFTQTTSGQKLAEYDLQRRGAGDLFGTQQHGFDQLKFAGWSDFKLIHRAKEITDQLTTNQAKYETLFDNSSQSLFQPLAN